MSGTLSGNATQDRKDLHRGVLVNLAGYAVKAAFPLLMGLVIRFYGKEEFGLFTAAQSVVLVALRFSVMGLDKAVLWWVSRQEERGGKGGVFYALLFSAGAAVVATVLVSTVLAPILVAWKEVPEVQWDLRLMAFSMLPMAGTEILVSAVLGKRRMESQLLVKELVQPISFLSVAVVLFLLDVKASNLACAFLISQVLAFLAALAIFKKVFGSIRRPEGDTFPRPMFKYALPMWGAEISNSFLLRLDTLVLFAMTDPGTVGIYGVVVMIGNAVRTIRRAFDPIVLAIFSKISVDREKGRLKAAFSHATVLVVASQLPVYAFLILFIPWILPLLGEGYDLAELPVLIICGFWMINGALGLNGLIVSGYGRSDLTLVNVLITIAVEAGLLALLIPRCGLEGAAVAVGASYTIQNIIQAVQARRLSGAWNYDRKVAEVVVIGLVAALLMVAGLLVLGTLGDVVARCGAFLLFLLVVAAGLLRMKRRGDLAQVTGQERELS